jgi:hypothetical protein
MDGPGVILVVGRGLAGRCEAAVEVAPDRRDADRVRRLAARHAT